MYPDPLLGSKIAWGRLPVSPPLSRILTGDHICRSNRYAKLHCGFVPATYSSSLPDSIAPGGLRPRKFLVDQRIHIHAWIGPFDQMSKLDPFLRSHRSYITHHKSEEQSSWHTGRRSAGVSVADHPGGLHTNRWATLGISLRATLNCLAFGALGL